MSQLRIIDFSDDEINQLLDHLYPALANEIEQLKTLMQGQKDSTITGSMYMREGVGHLTQSISLQTFPHPIH
jgi:hypothetical protein